MMPHDELCTEVLVIGSGIAGLSAAVYAAKMGAKVTLSSSVHLFSGSTFFPGTWGFGLVGPVDEHDERDLMDSILRLGQGMAREKMVETFVKSLNESVDLLEDLGITLEKPSEEAKEQKEYIPCFDHKHRRWRGLTKKNLLEAMPQVLSSLGIELLPHFEVMEILKEGERVTGAMGIHKNSMLLKVNAKAVILATGGLGGLYSHRLTTDDVNGSGVGLALLAGAKALNMEFMQIMLGFVKPGYKTVHNEKTFYASLFHTEEGKDLLDMRLPEGVDKEEVLRERSLHGPFSSETLSRHLDLCIHEEITEKNISGVTMTYDLAKMEKPAEFVKTYFDWLQKEKNIAMSEKILVAPFMHASNGGIYINHEGKTHVKGLFAAGECTGGMHGADRIGGLSTANGIVFGKIAGKNAAIYAQEMRPSREDEEASSHHGAFRPKYINDPLSKISDMRKIMYKHAFLKLEESGIEAAMTFFLNLTFHEEDKKHEEMETEGREIFHLRDSYRLRNAKAAALSLLSVQKERRESRGSFYRGDYPLKDDVRFRAPFMVSLKERTGHRGADQDFNILVEKMEKDEEIPW